MLLARLSPLTRSLHVSRPHNFLPRFAHLSMATENPAKRIKMDGPLVGTHNGPFHADEALAVQLLKKLPTYSNLNLVRTRDPAVLSTCHTVVDVGGEYDAARNRFDHHQREFNTVFPGHETKLSSAGLVFMHFGKDIIAKETGLPIDAPEVGILYEKLYSDFIEAFDANDNGVAVYPAEQLRAAGIKKKVEDRNYSVASVVGTYNKLHRALPKEATKEEAQAAEDQSFLRASEFVGELFNLKLIDYHLSWLPGHDVVRQAYSERHEVDPSGQIMIIPEGGFPWSEHLYNTERDHPDQPQVLYLLFPESTQPDSKWRIRAVSKEDAAFENRKDLPNAWKGVRDEELSKVSGISGCVFVHAAGFIGGNATKEGALAMAKKALTM